MICISQVVQYSAAKVVFGMNGCPVLNQGCRKLVSLSFKQGSRPVDEKLVGVCAGLQVIADIFQVIAIQGHTEGFGVWLHSERPLASLDSWEGALPSLSRADLGSGSSTRFFMRCSRMA